MKTILEVENLTVTPLYKDLSFSLYQGEIALLVGPNSCGKTTLFKILSGLISLPHTVFLENVNLENLTSLKKQQDILVYFEGVYPFHFNRVEDELENILYKKSHQEIQTLTQVLKQFGLTPLLKKNPQELNPLQKTRLLFVLAFLQKPKVLLLDDLFSKRCEKEKEILFEDLKFLKENGLTILLSSSNLEEALFVDRVLVLNKGSLILEGAPLTVLKEDSLLNKIGLQLPFFVDLSIKLQYYNLVNQIYLEQEKLVDAIWKSS